MSDKPIVIEITREGQGWPVGTEVGVERYDDTVRSLYPGARITRYQDGSEYVRSEPAKPARTESARKPEKDA